MAANLHPSCTRRRSSRPLERRKDELTVVGEPPWCNPPSPYAPGWTGDIWTGEQCHWPTPGSRSMAQSQAVVTSWLPVCWTHPGTPCESIGIGGLSTRVEWTWSFGLLNRGTGTLERQFWMQVLLHRRISLVSHLTSGGCWDNMILGDIDGWTLQYQKVNPLLMKQPIGETLSTLSAWEAFGFCMHRLWYWKTGSWRGRRMSSYVRLIGREKLGDFNSLLHKALQTIIILIDRHLGSDLRIQALT